jgi:soluble lytic murein transglycosylase-like protein
MVAVNTLTLLTLVPALALAALVPGHEGIARRAAHGRERGAAARAVGTVAQGRVRRRGTGQCRERPTQATQDQQQPQQTEQPTTTTSVPVETPAATPTETVAEQAGEQPQQQEQPATTQTTEQWQQTEQQPTWTPEATTTQTTAEPAPTQNPLDTSNAWAQPGGGSMLYANGPCGDSQPNANSPNGQQWWLNCGLDSGGWNPPFLQMDQVKYVDYSHSSFFEPCAPYFDIMKAAGATYNVPVTFIAAIAMMESTCNPDLTGGAGEQGMMQLVGVNCDGAPNGNCKDVWFNIHQGAKYLRDRTDANGGSLLLGLGAYNGWRQGMTTGDVANMAATWGCSSREYNSVGTTSEFNSLTPHRAQPRLHAPVPQRLAAGQARMGALCHQQPRQLLILLLFSEQYWLVVVAVAGTSTIVPAQDFRSFSIPAFSKQ